MTIEGSVAPLDRANVDTDQIIPAHRLTGIDTTGMGKYLFDGMAGGPEFLAANPGASIVVTRENFGCGSSREHAVWALQDRGFRAVIAPSFARIFAENAYNRGLAPIVVDATEIDRLMSAGTLVIDLEGETLRTPDGTQLTFALDPLRKRFILEGGYMEFLAKRVDQVHRWVAAREGVPS